MDGHNQSSEHAGLHALLAQVIHDFIHTMQQRGLSTPQIHALMYIYHAGDCRVSDIGIVAGASDAAASQLVERLVQQGLVERREDPADRRVKSLTLSAQATALIEGTVQSNLILTRLMASLSADERATVHAALAILAEAARRPHAPDKGKDNENA